MVKFLISARNGLGSVLRLKTSSALSCESRRLKCKLILTAGGNYRDATI